MKHFLSLIAAFVCVSLFAQQPEKYIPTHKSLHIKQLAGKHSAPQKSKADEKMLCDSIIYYEADGTPTTKYAYAYDSNGKKTKDESYVWNNGLWEGTYWTNKYSYTYDENGNITSETLYAWALGQWYLSTKEESIYDSDGNLITHIIYQWDIDANLIFAIKHEIVYDDKGNQIYRTDFDWEEKQWKEYYSLKFNNDYDENGNLVRTILFSPSEYGGWRELDMYVYTYSGSNIVSEIRYSPVFHGEYEVIWSEHEKRCYDYDANNNVVMAAYYDSYSERDKEWKGYTMQELTYDDNGHMTSSFYYSWTDGHWTGTGRSGVKYTFDEYGMIASQTNYSWKEGQWTTKERFKFEHNYDTFGNITRLETYYWEEGKWNTNGSYAIYYYPTLSVGITPLTNSQSSIVVHKTLKEGKLLIESDGHVYGVGGEHIR